MEQTRIGNYLVTRNILPAEVWDASVAESKTRGISVLEYLHKAAMISPAQRDAAYASSRGWDYEAFDPAALPKEALAVIEPAFARQYRVVPIRVTATEVTVAAIEPTQTLQKLLRAEAQRPVKVVYAGADVLDPLLRRHFSTQAESRRRGDDAVERLEQEGGNDQSELSDSQSSEISQFWATILETAITNRASDIHIELWEDYLSIRYTIDNKLSGEEEHSALLSRRLMTYIKNKAKMKSGSFEPDGGEWTVQFREEHYDLRIATLPNVWGGEAMTIRIQEREVRAMDEIGFTPENRSRWDKATSNPNGLVAITGPMGSGKSQTALATVETLKHDGRKVMTMERPVEVKIGEGVTQVQINGARNMDWKDTMPVLLRSRANVLFLGEINDDEVAHSATDASLTGHLVLTTLHTNTAPASVLRLREMGIRPSVLAETLRAVLAQRLPRALCECKVPVQATVAEIQTFKLSFADQTRDWFGPREGGCDKCMHLGYKGLFAIHELMTFNDEIRDLIIADRPTSEIAEAAKRNGMRTLMEDGLDRARQGMTSLAELRSHLVID